jgi:hypothetical protein
VRALRPHRAGGNSDWTYRVDHRADALFTGGGDPGTGTYASAGRDGPTTEGRPSVRVLRAGFARRASLASTYQLPATVASESSATSTLRRYNLAMVLVGTRPFHSLDRPFDCRNQSFQTLPSLTATAPLNPPTRVHWFFLLCRCRAQQISQLVPSTLHIGSPYGPGFTQASGPRNQSTQPARNSDACLPLCRVTSPY